MARYGVDYSCGHRGEIALFGPTKNRERRLEKEKENLCSDCHEKQLAEQGATAAQENAANGLLPLYGTEKQVLWAEQIRNAAMKLFESIEITPQSSFRLRDATQADIDHAIHDTMTKEKASWWIDNRTVFNPVAFVDFLAKELAEGKHKQTVAPKEAVSDARAESTVRPGKPKTETVAEIRIKGDTVEVDFPEKREDFWTVVKKQLNFSWSGTCWQRALIAKNGTPADRAAEVGHVLLAAGFPVRIYDGDVRQKAISGDFAAEQPRWILCRKEGAEYAGWFAIRWGKDDDFYTAAKRIPGSRWHSPSVVVPPEQYEQVMDFAERYGFAVSDDARGAADRAKLAKESALVVNVTNRQRAVHAASDKPPVLATPEEVEIHDVLRDTN